MKIQFDKDGNPALPNTPSYEENTHEESMFKYTDEVERIETDAFTKYCDYLVENNFDMTEESQKDFVGYEIGKNYSKLFKGNGKKKLASIYGKLEYSTTVDTKFNYNAKYNSNQKYLLGLKQIRSLNNEECYFVAKYEESKESGQPFKMSYSYYTLDDVGDLVLLKGKPELQQDQYKVMTIMQEEIVDKLEERKQQRADKLTEQIQLLNEENNISVIHQDEINFEIDENTNKIDNFESRNDDISNRKNDIQYTKGNFFDQALYNAGFDVKGIHTIIKNVNPEVFILMNEKLQKINYERGDGK